MTRLPPVPEEPGDPIVAEIFRQVRARVPRVPLLYRLLGHSPKILQGWTRFAWALRFDATTPRGLRELVIMRVAQLTGAAYEWEAHRPLALEHGVRPEQLEALPDWEGSGEFGEQERAVLRFTDEITRDLAVGDATFAELERRFSPEEIVELTLTAAFYSCVSRVLRALGLEPEDLPGAPAR